MTGVGEKHHCPLCRAGFYHQWSRDEHVKHVCPRRRPVRILPEQRAR